MRPGQTVDDYRECNHEVKRTTIRDLCKLCVENLDKKVYNEFQRQQMFYAMQVLFAYDRISCDPDHESKNRGDPFNPEVFESPLVLQRRRAATATA